MIRSDGIPYDEAVRVVARLLFGVARWSDDQMRDALHYLSEALLSGNVDASAVDYDSGVPVRLTAHKWMTYELVEYSDGRRLFLRPKGSMRRLGWLGNISIDPESLARAVRLMVEGKSSAVSAYRALDGGAQIEPGAPSERLSGNVGGVASSQNSRRRAGPRKPAAKKASIHAAIEAFGGLSEISTLTDDDLTGQINERLSKMSKPNVDKRSVQRVLEQLRQPATKDDK